MPAATLFGLALAPWLTWPIQRPALSRDELVQIGIRSVDEDEKALCAMNRSGSVRHAPDEMGMHGDAAGAHGVDDDTIFTSASTSISSDAELALGVGTGGPASTYREAQFLCMEMIADTGRLASLTSWN